jgi:hypothetical protein
MGVVLGIPRLPPRVPRATNAKIVGWFHHRFASGALKGNDGTNLNRRLYATAFLANSVQPAKWS